VFLLLNGDPDPIVDAEREHWRAFAAAGLLEDWETQAFEPRYENARAKLRDKYGQVGGDRAYELRRIAADTTVALLGAFDSRLPAVGEATEANPVPIGFWALAHFLSKHQGYDWYEEIDACSMAIRSRLVSLATFTSDDRARETLDEVIADLEALRSEFEG
jgi:hypothetical protein